MAQKWRFFTDCIVLEIGNCTTCEKTVVFFLNCSYVLSRACLGKHSIFTMQRRKKGRFRRPAGEGGGGGGAGACFFT